MFMEEGRGSGIEYDNGEALLGTVGEIIRTNRQTFGTDNNTGTSGMPISSRGW